MKKKVKKNNGVKKAVFPVAGMGTRFLPATKANPKEMMPVVDKPLIQFAVEEAVAAGIQELIFVTSSTKRAIEDHFDRNFELEMKLKEQEKENLLEIVQNVLPKNVSCVYIRQHEALGLGHAVLCAKNVVGDEPFALLLADDLIDGSQEQNCLTQMVNQFANKNATIIGVEKIDRSDSDKYGVIGFQDHFEGFVQINQITEKPKPSDAPSQFAVVGRYILTPRIFALLETVQAGKNGEIQLTDAISKLIQEEAVYAHQFKGVRYDCGSKLGYLRAIVAYGLKHKEVGDDFEQYLRSLDFSSFQKNIMSKGNSKDLIEDTPQFEVTRVL